MIDYSNSVLKAQRRKIKNKRYGTSVPILFIAIFSTSLIEKEVINMSSIVIIAVIAIVAVVFLEDKKH